MNINKLKRFLKRKVVLNNLEKGVRLFRDNKQDVVILCYHSVDNEGNYYSVSPELFEAHMSEIAKKATFVSLEKAISLQKSKKVRTKTSVAITFDDGYESIFSVLPILKKFKIPATVFALSSPENVNRVELDHKGKLLTYKQLQELHKAGIEIGCHSATHANFHSLRSKEQVKEIIKAKEVMEKKLSCTIRYFAYPKGIYNQPIVSCVKDAGYEAGFTTNHDLLGKRVEPFQIPRVVIDGSYDKSDFPAVFSASTFFIQSLHKAIFYNRFVFVLKELFHSEKFIAKQLARKTKSKKRITVSVATCAYNEENNIKRFLQSVTSQQGKHIVVKEVIVATDGCTDKTVSIINALKLPNVKVIEGKTRVGKSARLNQIFKSFTSDALVLCDADGYLESKETIATLVKPFVTENNIGLAAGKMVPLTPKSFIENAVVNFYSAHYRAVQFFDYNKSAYGCHGLLAYSKAFAKTLVIPQDCLVDDAFSYFSNESQGYSYRFVKDAVVHYRCPQTISDYLRQSLRYYAGGEQLLTYFEKSMVWEGYRLPRNVLMKTFFYQIKSDFFAYFLLKILHVYILYKTRIKSFNVNVQWSIAHSSKML